MKRFFVAWFLSAVAPLSAHAQTVIRFNVEQHCKQVAGFGGSYSEELYGFCIEQEQSSYNSLKAKWAETPKAIIDHCVKTAKFGGPGSYELLLFCVNQEIKARSSNAQKKFKF